MRLWPFLAAVSLAFAWLQPHHYNPWPGFHTNAVVAVWVLVAMVLVVAARVRPVEWPPITFVIGMMVCGVWLQHLAGFIVHSADAVFTSMHLLGCALIFVTVRALHTHNHLEKLGDIVFGALVVAGIGTVASALYQSVGIVPSDEFAGLGIWIMSLPDGVRAAGNVAQPNQMATMLVWASIGGLWAAYRGVIRWPILVLLSCYLALGMGISQSRVGLLEMFCLTIALAVWRQKMGGWAAFGAIALAMLVQAIVFFFLPAITQALLLDYDGRLLSQVINNTARLDIYEHVLFAILPTHIAQLHSSRTKCPVQLGLGSR